MNQKINQIDLLLREINFFQVDLLTGLHKPQAIIFEWEEIICTRKTDKNPKEYWGEFNYGKDQNKINNGILDNKQKKKSLNKLCQTNKSLIHVANSLDNIKLNEENSLIELLKLIKKLNIFCAIVSNKPKNILNQQIKFFGLEKYFNKIIGKGDCPSVKPMIDPMIYAIAESNVEFGKNIWIIGNNEIDMQFASITLSTGILYNPIIESKNPNKKNKIPADKKFFYRPDLEISHIKTLEEIIKRIFESNQTHHEIKSCIK